MHESKRALILLWTVLLVAACGGTSSGPVDDGGGDAGAGDSSTGGDADGGSEGHDADVASDGGGTGDSGGGGEACPVEGYAPCGGDVVGSWALRGLCPEDPTAAAELCESPHDDQEVCTGPGNEATCDGIHTGTMTFAADGTMSFETEIGQVLTWHYTAECLEAVGSGATPRERCEAEGNERVACTYEDPGCVCVTDPMVEAETGSATYTTTGDELTIGEDPPSTYCVDGDRLIMDYYVFHPVSWRYWVLERL